ncbi:MAG: hypothetical protein SV186_04770 [Candidatus Nanohaloarchaea archaeon]|nr:hypothetical protein [Candidatus Nanohaloarchaea archaeon]
MSEDYGLADVMDLTQDYEQLVDTLDEYREAVEYLEDAVEDYQDVLDQHRDGAADDEELFESMYEVAEAIDEVQDYHSDAREGHTEINVMLGMAEDDADYTAILTEAQLAYEKLTEGMDDDPEGVDGLDSLRRLYNTATDTYEQLEDAAFDAEEYLEETVGTTLTDLVFDDDPLLDAEIGQAIDRMKAAYRQEQPNDADRPTVAANGYDGLDAAREAVRDRPAAGFYADTDADVGPSEAEYEAIGRRIEEAREQVGQKDEIRGIW